MEKYRDNIAALTLLKRIESEGRMATPDEQRVLARYVGWGMFGQLFHPYNNYGESMKTRWNQWKPQHDELKTILTDEEWRAASGSTVNAHYTAPNVITAMWAAVQRLGFQRGRILEPSCGAGNFFGLMPSDMWRDSPATAVDLDDLSARLTQQLYQSADVLHSGFQDADTVLDNFYDLAISNVPFGNYGVTDAAFGSPLLRFLTRSIHNYFFAKALTKVRPGGLVAFVTSSFTLDSPSHKRVREHLMRNADFLGAIRLPNDAFRENAGTEVTTDVIFLRRRVPGDEPAGESFVDVGEIDTPSGAQVRVNEYYQRHPEMLLGEMGLFTRNIQGGMQPGMKSDGRDIDAAMEAALRTLPENVYTAAGAKKTLLKQDVHQHDFEHRIGSFVEKDGKLFVVEASDFVHLGYDQDGNAMRAAGPNVLVPCTLEGKRLQRVVDVLPLRDRCRELIDAQTNPNTSEPELDRQRAALNFLYDQFVKKHDAIHTRGNLIALAHEPDLALLCALERYDPKTGAVSKADIFTKRTVQPYSDATSADSPEAAMLISLNERHGLDWEHMAALTGSSKAELQASLCATGHIFHNPAGALRGEDAYETADAYLSGDVRKKLKAAEVAAKQEPRYQANVEALRAVQPRDLLPHEISTKLGATWIDPKIVAQFVNDTLGIPSWNQDNKGAKVDLAITGDWLVSAPHTDYHLTARSMQQWGSGKFRFSDLVHHALNGTRPQVWIDDGDGKRHLDGEATQAAQEKMQEVKTEFLRWLWSDAARSEKLAAVYNTTFNSLAERKFNGQHLSLPGLSQEAKGRLQPHIKDAVWRQLTTPNTLLNHCVGAGKTWEAACGAIEARRRGLAKKPMITVPNHLVGQWASEIMTLYPDAKVLMATKKDFEKGNRQKLMARIATGDWDAVVIAHSSFGRIPVGSGTEQKFYQEQLDQIDACLQDLRDEEGGKKSMTTKNLEKQKRRLEKKLQDRMARQKDVQDDLLTFEQLGVDRLLVDEAHMFKNLFFATRKGRIKGIPQGSDSGRAFDMFMKVRNLQGRNGGGGVTFLTGTPVTNTICEAYTLMRYMNPQWLAEHNMSSFDSWAANFGEESVGMEYTATGEYKPVTRFNEFVNTPELSAAMQTFMDTKTSQQLALPVPTHERHIVPCPSSDHQNAYVMSLADRAQDMKDGKVDPSTDNMLKLTSDARKNSLDPRLVNPDAPENHTGKIATAATQIAQIYREGMEGKTTQTVFLDLGTPKAAKGDSEKPAPTKPEKESDGVDALLGNEEADAVEDTDTEEERGLQDSIYQNLRDKLTAQGVPNEEIAFIHEAKTDAQKKALFDRVNSGEIRILIGSTEKMGTGMNAQKRMVALHHLDCPWRPDQVEQREGRIIRQGNTNKHVHIYTYATTGINGARSMDAVLWGIVEGKAKSIADLYQNNGSRSIQDVSDTVLSAGMVKGVAAGDPRMEEYAALQHNLHLMDMRHSEFLRTQHQAKKDLEAYPGKMADLQARVARIGAAIDLHTKHKPQEGEKFAATLLGQHFDNRESAGQQMLAEGLAASKRPSNAPPMPLGRYLGFDLSVGKDPTADCGMIHIRVPGQPLFLGDISLANASNGAGIVSRVDNFLKGLKAAKVKLESEQQAREQQGGIAVLQELADRPFPRLEEYQKMQARYAELDKELGVKEGERAGVEQEELSKAIALGKIERDAQGNKTRTSMGQASAPTSSLSAKLPAWHGARLLPMAHAAAGAGLDHQRTAYKQDASGGHHYLHQFVAPNTRQAETSLRASLEETHRLIHKTKTTGIGPHGMPVTHRQLTFAARDGSATHIMQIANHPSGLHQAFHAAKQAVKNAPTAIRQSPKTVPPRVIHIVHTAGRAAAKVGGAAARAATGAVKRAAAKRAPLAEDRVHTAPIAATGQAYGAVHARTDVRRTKRNMVGEATDRHYQMHFTHHRPEVTANRMARSLEAAGHTVTGVTRNRIANGSGEHRHVYSFHTTPQAGGPSHTVKVWRG